MKTHKALKEFSAGNSQRSRLKQALLAGTYSLFAGLLMVSNTNATSVKVRVLDASTNAPVAGAAVCLGKSSQDNIYGAQRTDRSGMANFSDLPNHRLILTVSRSQHKGIKRPISLGGVDLVRTIHLPKGGSGPVCDAPPILISSSRVIPTNSDSSIMVTNLNIDKGQEVTNTRRVVLNPRVIGNPTHYRISENPRFEGADWMKYQQTPLYTLSEGEGRKKVYFQVRRAVEMGEGTIQTLSNVRTDLIMLRSEY